MSKGLVSLLNEKRWGTTLAFCRATIPAVSVLTRAWKQRAYEGQGEHALKEKDWEEGGIFKPAELSTLLRSALFRAYHHMIVKLHHPPHRLASWFEGCPCHEIIMSTPGDDQRICPARREAAMKADGVSYGRCVLSSCRVVESVDGKVDEVINDINQEISDSFRHTLVMKDQDGLLDTASRRTRQSYGDFRFHTGIVQYQAWSLCQVWLVEKNALAFGRARTP